MPRKKLIYTHLYPYHIVGRSNNRENFYVDKDICWGIFLSKLMHLSKEFGFKTHAFLLMDNHYHLLGSASSRHELGEVMCWFHTSVSRTINSKAGRINHVFGGPYRPTLITKESYYYHSYRYLFQNPLRAGMVNSILKYKYSSFSMSYPEVFGIAPPENGIDSLVPKNKAEEIRWINHVYNKEQSLAIKKGLMKTEFKFVNPGKRKIFDLH